MGAKYILNIKTGKIHNAVTPCIPCRKTTEGNKKHFEVYEEAVNFFEGKTQKGEPCGICMKDKDE